MTEQIDGEKCVRCGEVGEDRRTLYHSCFYAMEELGLPFERSLLFHVENLEGAEIVKPASRINLSNGASLTLSPPLVKTDSELRPHEFYTLRVCKACRSSWMEAIQHWFKTSASTDAGKRSVGTGIFVRRNGTNVEVTEEEFYAMRREKEAAMTTKKT